MVLQASAKKSRPLQQLEPSDAIVELWSGTLCQPFNVPANCIIVYNGDTSSGEAQTIAVPLSYHEGNRAFQSAFFHGDTIKRYEDETAERQERFMDDLLEENGLYRVTFVEGREMFPYNSVLWNDPSSWRVCPWKPFNRKTRKMRNTRTRLDRDNVIRAEKLEKQLTMRDDPVFQKLRETFLNGRTLLQALPDENVIRSLNHWASQFKRVNDAESIEGDLFRWCWKERHWFGLLESVELNAVDLVKEKFLTGKEFNFLDDASFFEYKEETPVAEIGNWRALAHFIRTDGKPAKETTSKPTADNTMLAPRARPPPVAPVWSSTAIKAKWPTAKECVLPHNIPKNFVPIYQKGNSVGEARGRSNSLQYHVGKSKFRKLILKEETMAHYESLIYESQIQEFINSFLEKHDFICVTFVDNRSMFPIRQEWWNDVDSWETCPWNVIHHYLRELIRNHRSEEASRDQRVDNLLKKLDMNDSFFQPLYKLFMRGRALRDVLSDTNYILGLQHFAKRLREVIEAQTIEGADYKWCNYVRWYLSRPKLSHVNRKKKEILQEQGFNLEKFKAFFDHKPQRYQERHRRTRRARTFDDNVNEMDEDSDGGEKYQFFVNPAPAQRIVERSSASSDRATLPGATADGTNDTSSAPHSTTSVAHAVANANHDATVAVAGFETNLASPMAEGTDEDEAVDGQMATISTSSQDQRIQRIGDFVIIDHDAFFPGDFEFDFDDEEDEEDEDAASME